MPAVDLRTYNNDTFDRGSSRLIELLWYFVNVLFFINPINPSSGVKVFLLRLFGADIGKGVVIKPQVSIKFPWKLTIGNDVWIGEEVWIDNLDDVVIGNNVCISQGAMLLCGNHDYKKSTFDLLVRPIILEEGSWVGAQAVVCPGVTLHKNSILTVGSIATKDLNSNTIYQGNPALPVRNRNIS